MRKLAVAGLVVAGIAGSVALAALVAWSLEEAPHRRTRPPTGDRSAPELASGTVTEENGRPIPGSVVYLVIVNSDGKEVSRHQFPVGEDGSFRITADAVPLISNVAAAMVIAQADSYLSRKANVIIAGQSAVPVSVAPAAPDAAPVAAATQPVPRIYPQRIQLVLQPYNSALVLILLLPAIFGLVIAVLHLTGFSSGLGISKTYAVGTAVLWGLVVLWLLWLYVQQRARAALIPLFWDDLFVSSGVVVFAFLGTLVYVAFSMHEKDPGFFELPKEEKRKVLLTLGGRILVAPYVAVAAYGILAATFPALTGGEAAAFFGFFTGLWIKPVLEALNDVGLRLLSAESRAKVAARLTDQSTVPREAVSSSAAQETIEPEFLAAVREARNSLLALDHVIGVAPGERLRDGQPTGQRAIVAYVDEKVELAEGNHQRVPDSIEGFPTDVQELPPPPADGRCDHVMLSVSAEKVAKLHPGAAHSAPVETIGGVAILLDPDASRYFPAKATSRELLLLRRAYDDVRAVLGDEYDFVAFIIDTASGLKPDGPYFMPIYNEVKGIGFYRDPSPKKTFDERATWGVARLRGFQVHSVLSMRTWLHEIGHAWSSYVSPSGLPPMLDGTGLHWADHLHHDSSCMNEARMAWQLTPEGRYRRVTISGSSFVYSTLDLYLMGLLPLADVEPLRFLAPAADGSDDFVVSRQEPATSLLATFGERSPPAGVQQPVTFRQAFVVVSKTLAAATTLANAINVFRPKLEARFEIACTHQGRVLARLSTARV